jgi:hypothetical protein
LAADVATVAEQVNELRPKSPSDAVGLQRMQAMRAALAIGTTWIQRAVDPRLAELGGGDFAYALVGDVEAEQVAANVAPIVGDLQSQAAGGPPTVRRRHIGPPRRRLRHRRTRLAGDPARVGNHVDQGGHPSAWM